jgi:hypothetical protein
MHRKLIQVYQSPISNSSIFSTWLLLNCIGTTITPNNRHAHPFNEIAFEGTSYTKASLAAAEEWELHVLQ